MSVPDTDGILDRCSRKGCGARAFVSRTIRDGYVVACTECGEATGEFEHKAGATCAWNKAQRMGAK